MPGGYWYWPTPMLFAPVTGVCHRLSFRFMACSASYSSMVAEVVNRLRNQRLEWRAGNALQHSINEKLL